MIRFAAIPALLLSAAATTLPAQISRHFAPLEPTIDAITSGGVRLGLMVLDPAGQPVLERNADALLKPASNNKLFTTAAALELLGPDFETSTVLRLSAPPAADGTLDGHLTITGYGDPTLSGRFEPDSRNSTAPLARMAKFLKQAGLDKLDGDILVDSTYFSGPAFHPAWPGGERGEWYSAEVSALAFNDNCVDLDWSSEGLLPGDRARVDLLPSNTYVKFESSVTVAARGRVVGRSYRRGLADNSITASGQLPVETRTLDSAAIHDGALWFGSVFRDVLQAEGIPVSGTVRHATPAERSAIHNGPVVSLPSQKLPAILSVINRNSQNFYAECLIRILGALPETGDFGGPHAAEPGSWERGCAVATAAVGQLLQTGGTPVMVDGSGLSHQNRATARQLARLCHQMTLSRHRAIWEDSLAQGATRGSLRTRFRQTSDTAALGARIFGKTGLIAGVRAVSGQIESPRGPFAFSLVLNDIPTNRGAEALRQMDALLLEIVKAVDAAAGEAPLHPSIDREPHAPSPLSVAPRTTPIPIPSPTPDFAAGKILNDTSKLWFARIRQFEQEMLDGPPAFTTGSIVLLGDSLTERFPMDLLGDLPVVNRGIGGDKIGGSNYLGLLDRMTTSVLLPEPRAVVLLIGTNDIVFARTNPENMRHNYRRLLDEIRAAAPDSRIIVVSTPPAKGRQAIYNAEIDQYNQFLRDTAAERGLDFIDLNPAVRSKDSGELDDANATDDLHFSEAGYRIYAALLRPVLRQALLQPPLQRRGNPKNP